MGMINPVNQIPNTSAVNSAGNVNTNTQTTQNTENNANNNSSNNSGVIVEFGNKPEQKVTYSKPNTVNIDPKRIEELKMESEKALEPLRKMVEALLKEQGINVKKAKGELTDNILEITPEIRAEAQKKVGDGGDYSAEKVSDRLVEFAKAISGGDKSKLDEIRAAIKKGYNEAEKAFGGELPDISKQTLDKTMTKLNDWEKEGNPVNP